MALKKYKKQLISSQIVHFPKAPTNFCLSRFQPSVLTKGLSPLVIHAILLGLASFAKTAIRNHLIMHELLPVLENTGKC